MTWKLFAVLLCCHAMAFGYSWRGRIDLGTATAGTLNNITLVSVTVSDAHLKLASGGGTIQDATCSHVLSNLPCDLILTDDANCGAGATAYKWGYETYDGIAGTARLFVLVPALTAPVHATPWVCTGDPAVHSYQGGSVGSEFSNTVADLHLANGTALSLADFSGNTNNGSNHGAPAGAGKIGGAAGGFLTSSGYFSLPSSTSLNITGNITLSAWVFLNATTDGVILGKGSCGVDNPAYGLSIGTSYGSVANRWAFQLSNAAFTTTKLSDTASASTGVWTYLAGVWDGTTAHIFVNGVEKNTAAFAGPIYTNTQPVWVGADGGCSGRWFVDGLVDEPSVENTARSAAWIATKYANQNNPPSITNWVSLSAPAAGLPPAIY